MTSEQEQQMDVRRAAAALLEELAGAVMGADAADGPAVQALVARFEELAALGTAEGPLRVEAVTCVGRLTAALQAGGEAVSQALDAACEATARMQEALAKAPPAALPGLTREVAEASLDPERIPADEVLPERVERDAETVNLFGEFLGESAEGLTQVDQILMNVERDGGDADTVNSLFRVFHTIKGTAGFLDLADVIELAHSTESMMNRCREGAMKLDGPVIDLVFDSTAALRQMLTAIREGLEKGSAFPKGRDVSKLLARLKDATEGKSLEETELPLVEEGAKLGEVLALAPISIAPQAIQDAMEAQQVSGRRLGEELVAAGTAQPAQVAQALRAQARGAKTEAEAPVKLKETIKVDVERIDSLVEMIGELVVVESMVVNAPEIAHHSSVRVRNCLGQLAKVTRDLQDVGMRMRMVPVAGVFQKMARVVRDLSHRSGKQVRLTTSGEGTEMDRSMVEQIADPLVHMIRNSMDHGVEGPDERRRAGKPADGVVRLSAYHESGSVVIEVADDGRGLDREKIAKKAIEKGLIPGTEGMTESEIHALIFAPGFSTAQEVTEISGRGVGMDVVKRNVEAMRGRVLISSVKGEGTTFKIVLPLTLAIIDGMLVACGEDRYIIPTLSIVESIQPDAQMLVSLAGSNEMINLRGEILPLLRMDRLFSVKGAKSDPTQALVVVIEGVGRRVGLLVDEVVAQQQVVIKSLGSGFRQTPFVSGAAILADGRVGLILNVEEIAQLVVKKSHGVSFEGGTANAAAPANEDNREVRA